MLIITFEDSDCKLNQESNPLSDLELQIFSFRTRFNHCVSFKVISISNVAN